MFRLKWKKAIVVLVVLVVLGIGAAAFIPVHAAVPDTTPNNFIVHEWGTFTTFAGSDGETLRFTPTAEDLPDFVYKGCQDDADKKQQMMFSKLRMSTLVSLETPVLYFYADREMTASVDVVFPKGKLTEHYPRSNPAPASWLRWDGLKIMPGAVVDFPMKPGPNRYYAAREVDAAPIRMDMIETVTEPTDTTLLSATMNKVFGLPKTREVKHVKQEHEKFIFYRGAGNFVMPLKLTATAGGTIVIKNTGWLDFGKSVLVRIEGKKVRFTEIARVGGNAQVEVQLPDSEGSLGQLGEVMVRLLAEQGLYEKEARAMVKTWDSAWFGEEGTRLLYLVPVTLTDEVLPLRINPVPDQIVRVLVGRHDFLTPEREREIEAMVKRSQAELPETERAILQKELGKLGRFESPAVSAAHYRLRQNSVTRAQE